MSIQKRPGTAGWADINLVITLTMYRIKALNCKNSVISRMDKNSRNSLGLFGTYRRRISRKGLDKILTMWFTYSVAGNRAHPHKGLSKN